MGVKGQNRHHTQTIAHPWSLWNGFNWQLQVRFAQGGSVG